MLTWAFFQAASQLLRVIELSSYVPTSDGRVIEFNRASSLRASRVIAYATVPMMIVTAGSFIEFRYCTVCLGLFGVLKPRVLGLDGECLINALMETTSTDS